MIFPEVPFYLLYFLLRARHYAQDAPRSLRLPPREQTPA